MIANRLILRRMLGGIGLACTLLGLYLGGQLAIDLATASSSSSWPTVSGLIQIADVRYIQRGSGPDSSYWHVDIQYDYEAGGNRRHGTHITAGDAQSYSTLATYPSRFKAGDTITVYYNPRDPGQSLLLPGVNTAHWVVMIAPTLLLVLGVVFTLVAAKLPTINNSAG